MLMYIWIRWQFVCDADQSKLYLGTFLSVSAKLKAHHIGSDSFGPELTLAVFLSETKWWQENTPLEHRILIQSLSVICLYSVLLGQSVTWTEFMNHIYCHSGWYRRMGCWEDGLLGGCSSHSGSHFILLILNYLFSLGRHVTAPFSWEPLY